MEDRPKIDFKQHTLPPVSKRFMLRMIIYVVILIFLIIAIYKLPELKKRVKSSDHVEEIRGVQISE